MSIYRLTYEAIQDLDDIVSYLSSFSLHAVNRFLNAFEQKCETLANLPRIGKIYCNL
jgi:toxin ParE1/3/4